MTSENDKTELVGSDEPASDQRATEPSGARDTRPDEPPTDVLPASDSAGDPPDETLAAPTYRSPVAGPKDEPETSLEAGDKIDDFELIEVLGRGAFGTVYLARQVSLDRRVALKVTENRGSEGRTMARLEHQHVVQVFSETVDDTGRRRLLCMQLVPGASLESVIRELNLVSLRKGVWSGQDYLAAIDMRTRVGETLDPSALRDREMIDESNAVETSAWVGARLAEALNFAHKNNVLHRDIKPANVLINQYGRPLLADFNISLNADPEADKGEQTFGGTLSFMAPEHLEAFSPHCEATPDDVDERSDIYSLGIVVYELLTGRAPFSSPKREGSRTRYVGSLAELRRTSPPPIEDGPPTARKVLERTIAKSLAGEKEDRYQTGEEFAAALDGCRRLGNVERTSPPAGSFARSVISKPLFWSLIMIFGPQVIGSVVNIAYNNYQISNLLEPEQQELFPKLVTWYNLLVYPAALGALVYFFRPVFGMWKRLQGCERIDAREVAAARRAAVRLPLWILVVAAMGWLPGGVIFPVMLGWLTPPLDAHAYLHFLVSFAFSGLIAVAYSFCGMQYLLMRVLYPRLWTDPTNFQAIARKELSGTVWRTWFCEIAANSIPPIAAVLLAMLTTDEGGIPLRTIIVSLVVLGIVGTAVVRVATRVMSRIQVALTGES